MGNELARILSHASARVNYLGMSALGNLWIFQNKIAQTRKDQISFADRIFYFVALVAVFA